ncbi:MAG TPA: gliding motility-associated C-terminal domain-containing protein, partial [Cyclobacteriaceae bacterium]
TSGNFGAGDYRCLVSGDLVPDKFSDVASLIVSPNNPPATSGNSGCAGSIALSASGGTDGQYRWYDVVTGGAHLEELNSVFITPELFETTTYYVAILGVCESTRTPVIATILSPPAPTVTDASVCSNGTVTLTATGGGNGQYRWYDVETGGTASDQTNGSFLTPSLTSTTTYYASIDNGTCEGERAMATVTVFTPPAKPIINSSITPNGNAISICKQPLTLTATEGFNSYKWSNGATTQSITMTSPISDLSVIVTDNNGCSSPSSDPLQIVALASCLNAAPNIATALLTTVLEGSVGINLLSLISDSDNNLDPGSLRIVTQPTSGALATIDSDGNLVIDYKGISFSGRDRIGIEACDFSGVCTQQELTIDVVGNVVVYNGVSPNGDGKNDFLLFQYIEVLEETKNNRVSIFNRWGDVVFEVTNYDNTTKIFSGQNKNGNDLPSGSYFYRIDFESNKESMTGYLTLKR